MGPRVSNQAAEGTKKIQAGWVGRVEKNSQVQSEIKAWQTCVHKRKREKKNTKSFMYIQILDVFLILRAIHSF